MLACTQEHRRVADAIVAGDPQAAEEAMRDHIEKLQESFFSRLTHA
jgi:DNA-binding FadR family transcriptional regulator